MSDPLSDMSNSVPNCQVPYDAQRDAEFLRNRPVVLESDYALLVRTLGLVRKEIDAALSKRIAIPIPQQKYTPKPLDPIAGEKELAGCYDEIRALRDEAQAYLTNTLVRDDQVKSLKAEVEQLNEFIAALKDECAELEMELAAFRDEPRYTAEQVRRAVVDESNIGPSRNITTEPFAFANRVIDRLSPHKTPEERVTIEEVERSGGSIKRVFCDGREIKDDDLLECARMYLIAKKDSEGQ